MRKGKSLDDLISKKSDGDLIEITLREGENMRKGKSLDDLISKKSDGDLIEIRRCKEKRWAK